MLGAFVDENVEKSSSEEISSINNAIGGGRPITFSGGDGSEGNPWQITDLDDLQYLSETSGYWGRFFLFKQMILMHPLRVHGMMGMVEIRKDLYRLEIQVTSLRDFIMDRVT